MEDKMFCKYCGEKIDSDSSFCPECGEKINNSMETGDDELQFCDSSIGGKVVNMALKNVGKEAGNILVEVLRQQQGPVKKTIQKKINKRLDGTLKKVGLKEKTPLEHLWDAVKKSKK